MSEAAFKALQEARAWVLNPHRQSIELDCAPGLPRPGDLLPGVIEGLGLEIKEPRSKVFGNWEWDYSEVPHDRWMELKPILRERITALHNRGVIRWGSW